MDVSFLTSFYPANSLCRKKPCLRCKAADSIWEPPMSTPSFSPLSRAEFLSCLPCITECNIPSLERPIAHHMDQRTNRPSKTNSLFPCHLSSCSADGSLITTRKLIMESPAAPTPQPLDDPDHPAFLRFTIRRHGQYILCYLYSGAHHL